MANQATTFRNLTTIGVRSAEVPGASWTTGCNNASCSPGVGVASDVPNLDGDPSGWTLLDQFEDARTPQVSQLIGGNGLGAGVPGHGVLEAEYIIGVINGADGAITVDGAANLATLAAGWTLV